MYIRTPRTTYHMASSWKLIFSELYSINSQKCTIFANFPISLFPYFRHMGSGTSMLPVKSRKSFHFLVVALHIFHDFGLCDSQFLSNLFIKLTSFSQFIASVSRWMLCASTDYPDELHPRWYSARTNTND